jgi:hypothetical protein
MNEVKKSMQDVYKAYNKKLIYMSSKILSTSAGQPINSLNPRALRKTFNESYLPVSQRAHS